MNSLSFRRLYFIVLYLYFAVLTWLAFAELALFAGSLKDSQMAYILLNILKHLQQITLYIVIKKVYRTSNWGSFFRRNSLKLDFFEDWCEADQVLSLLTIVEKKLF